MTDGWAMASRSSPAAFPSTRRGAWRARSGSPATAWTRTTSSPPRAAPASKRPRRGGAISSWCAACACPTSSCRAIRSCSVVRAVALRVASAILVLVGLAAGARADDVLVLKDGRRIAVRRLARREGQVLFETTKGERFSVAEDQVVSPPLDSIPQADAPPSGTGATEQTLVLKDGRRIQVRRLGRRDGIVLFETTRGEAFSVREDQVVSPPVESIPVVGGAAPADQVKEQTLVIKDGLRIQVLRLARVG